ncbi:hypothetical protein OGAPHI_005782 [Ogataea philodendri]|uniref:Dilute domain-containing protein n=1 Tax=Ogataea philodendri TaxID=1378263 RepID=A0A9P8NZV2_9ASCO|nr:uncharacterized protein OGAPHI_005782 [Ogataea philodendri]KAH3662530.1 hypothetical protein OGAPHI_005782 [Ogataea philodendri]
MSLDPWKATISAVLSSDTNWTKVLAAKKALEAVADSNPFAQLCLACTSNDHFQLSQFVSSAGPEKLKQLNQLDGNGLSPLIYSVCFNSLECVSVLVSLVDVNECDSLLQWTPVMWATYLENVSIVELLLANDADPYLRSKRSNQNALDLAKLDSEVYQFYKTHNYLDQTKTQPDEDTFYKKDPLLPTDDQFETRLKALTVESDEKPASAELYKGTKFVDDDDDIVDANDSFYTDSFDFGHLLPRQFVKVSDDSISATIDYIFSLSSKYQHRAIYPAAVVFQSVRYISGKLESMELAESFVDLFLTRVRSVTNTKSGVVQLVSGSGTDIVLLGYWISCLNHLQYFFSRDTACPFFSKSSKTVQDLILTLQSLIFQLAFAMDAKLEPLLEPCVLDYSSVPDLDTVYKAQWRMFKHKVALKSTYDEILEMLYPPSLADQMKPSPLKIIQTLGALVYVLELHHVNDILKQQCFSAVFYWFGASVFNRVLANKKYSTRVKALQIRLNLSYIQDWLRTNNLIPFRPESLDFKDDSYPESIVGQQTKFNNVARFHNHPQDPMDGTFYYNPLYKIGQYHLMPLIELLEWLQVMSGLTADDLGTLKEVMNRFDVLNSEQLLHVIKVYRYEITEQKFPKTLKNHLKQSSTPCRQKVFYTGSEKLFLNPAQVFPVVLCRKAELLHQYGSDQKKIKLYQPNLPIEIIDDLEDIYDKYTDHEEQALESSQQEAHGTDLFKELAVPTSIAYKTWESEDDNPWK